MTDRSARIRPAFLRIVALMAALALIAVACGGGTEDPTAESVGTNESSETDESSETSETASGDTTEPEPTAIPAPTATAVPEATAIPDPTATAVPTVVANADSDSDAVTGTDTVLREAAIAEVMESEGDDEELDRATAECMVDAVYDTTGTYTPTEEQELEAFGAAMLCVFSAMLSPETLTEAAVEDGHPRPTAECLGTRIGAMLADLDIDDEGMSPDEELALTTDLNTCGDPLGGATGDAAPGDDADLDALWVGCSDGVAQDCQSLSNATFFDDEQEQYQQFALSCGGRVIVEIDCGLWIDGESLVIADGQLAVAPETGSAPPGTDVELDALWEACSAASGAECDTLYLESPVGSEYEVYGYTCGGRVEGGSSCEDESEGSGDLGSDLDDVPDPGSPSPGDDPLLDSLWEACNAEDGVACDNLYFDSPLGSVYEVYGYTCGGRVASFDAECSLYFDE